MVMFLPLNPLKRSETKQPGQAATRSDIAYPGTSLIKSPSFTTQIFRPTLGRWPLWIACSLAIVLGIILVTILVYRTGGTTYAYPYLILLPVIFSGAVFKVPGGLIAALVAALALGPWMPLDVASGTMQSTENWLVRMGMYIAIGGFAGVLSTALFIRQQQALIRERVDPVTGLLSPMTASRLRTGTDTAETNDIDATYAVVIAFEGLGSILRTLGIDASNRMICEFGSALTRAIGDEALVTRIHGSTFGLLLPYGQRRISWMVKRLRERMPEAITVDNFSMIPMPRFGIAKIGDDDRVNGQPFRKPMAALHVARIRGKSVARYSGAQDRQARDNLALIGEFSEALIHGNLAVHFQPKVDIKTGRAFAAEALIRWQSGTRGFVSPARFIPLIEHTTLIDPMTRFVAEETVRTSAEWCSRGLNVSISINISTTLLHNSEFVSFLANLPQRYGMSAADFEIEITETALMEDILAMQSALELLRKSGFPIAIDDFGTGYSSLKYLKDLPIQWVKLDQSFVRDLPDNKASCEISAATAAICKRLNYKVIAEGVETTEALEFLRTQKYDAAQGYLYAKPMAAEEFFRWASENHATGATDPNK